MVGRALYARFSVRTTSDVRNCVLGHSLARRSVISAVTSRVERLKIDPWNGTVTLEQTWNQPGGLVASSQGNAQTTRDRNLFVGWGSLPYFSEFDQAGRLLFNAQFPTGVNSYRAYLLRWAGGRAR